MKNSDFTIRMDERSKVKINPKILIHFISGLHHLKQIVYSIIRFQVYLTTGLEEDYVHLCQDDWVYVCPISREFDYWALLEMYTKSWKLGSGGFGNVYKLKHRLNKRVVAAKFVRVSGYLHKADTVQQILKEAQYLMQLDHKNILKFESAFLIKQEIIILTEFVPGGELGEFLSEQPGPLNEDQAWAIMTELVSAIHYCHSK